MRSIITIAIAVAAVATASLVGTDASSLAIHRWG